MNRTIGMAIILVSVAGFSFAGVVSAPEIDGSSAVAAVGLLAGGLLVLRSRKKSS
jgi:MYXO-CTERM domain-containing protein